MNDFTLNQLKKAENVALDLFHEIELRKYIQPGISEQTLNEQIFSLAKEKFGISKYWHKRIVRSGKNTLLPYRENPENLIIQTEDIVFFDFGPILEEWEADFGRTYVVGKDPHRKKLMRDTEKAWIQARNWYMENQEATGSEFFKKITEISHELGWTFGGEIGGHLIGQFPHEKLDPGIYDLYVHPENHLKMNLPDKDGNPRNWILEIHLVDRNVGYGGFFEQLLV